MGSIFGGGGGGGGSPPVAPKLKQVSTSLTGPLYKRSAAIGDEWANLMRGSYGLGQSTGPASWEAQYLGPGALATMGQARGLIEHPGTDPQLSGLEKTAGFGDVNLGNTPFEVSANLGQQFRAPLGQLQRGQNLTSALTTQWKPPQLRLTGEDLLNVAMGNATQSAQAQQQAFAMALQGRSASEQAQSLANTSALNAWTNAGTGIIKAAFNSPSLTGSGGSGFFGNLFGGYQGDMAAGASPEEYGGGSP